MGGGRSNRASRASCARPRTASMTTATFLDGLASEVVRGLSLPLSLSPAPSAVAASSLMVGRGVGSSGAHRHLLGARLTAKITIPSQLHLHHAKLPPRSETIQRHVRLSDIRVLPSTAIVASHHHGTHQKDHSGCAVQSNHNQSARFIYETDLLTPNGNIYSTVMASSSAAVIQRATKGDTTAAPNAARARPSDARADGAPPPGASIWSGTLPGATQ